MGRKGQKVKRQNIVSLDIWITVALMCRKHYAVGTGHPVCKCELQVWGHPSSPGYMLYLQAESRCRGYHRLLTSCNRFAQNPGNSVPALDRLMNVKSLDSCVGNL